MPRNKKQTFSSPSAKNYLDKYSAPY